MNTRTDSAIETSGLTDPFGRTTALDGLDLNVDTGERHGCHGAGGAERLAEQLR